MRRRERIVAPIGDAIYGGWLDEQVVTGKIPFKGGYEAFRANRDRLLWTQWRGPAKPSADDSKSAEASGEGSHGSILNGNYAPNRLSSAWKPTKEHK